MNAPASTAGAAPVGDIATLPATEAGAVLYLRLWCDGPEAQERVWNDFATGLGAGHGRTALHSLEQLCLLCARHGRRPLMRHHLTCRCLGADEACFARFVAAAAEGEQEDAMLMATLLVRADMAPSLVGLARTFGLALRRLALRRGIPAAGPEGPGATLH